MSETEPKPQTKAQKVATADAARQSQVAAPSPDQDPNLVQNAQDLVKPGSNWVYGNGLQISNR